MMIMIMIYNNNNNNNNNNNMNLFPKIFAYWIMGLQSRSKD